MTTTVPTSVYSAKLREDVFSGSGDKAFVAEDPSLPGCLGYGATQAEALEMLDRARGAYLEDLSRRNVPPPYRLGSVTVSVEKQERLAAVA